jgi:tape measure domain-containing protein
MESRRKLLLEPDWPRMWQLVTRSLGKSEDEVQAMLEKGDSLDKVNLKMEIEEMLEKIRQ